jgi:hypothetical protein
MSKFVNVNKNKKKCHGLLSLSKQCPKNVTFNHQITLCLSAHCESKFNSSLI